MTFECTLPVCTIYRLSFVCPVARGLCGEPPLLASHLKILIA